MMRAFLRYLVLPCLTGILCRGQGVLAAEIGLDPSSTQARLRAGPQTWWFNQEAGQWSLAGIEVRGMTVAQPSSREDSFWMGAGEGLSLEVLTNRPTEKAVRLGEKEPKAFAALFDRNLGGRLSDVCEKYFAGGVDMLVGITKVPRSAFDLLRNPAVPVQHSPFYISGPGPMLVAGCRFFISSRNLWNHGARNRRAQFRRVSPRAALSARSCSHHVKKQTPMRYCLSAYERCFVPTS
jgi:hypothetical protein